MHEIMIQEPFVWSALVVKSIRVETERAYFATYLPTFIPYIQFYVIFYYESVDWCMASLNTCEIVVFFVLWQKSSY